jgi:Predicted metal binding domain
MDPAVSQKKFDRETELLGGDASSIVHSAGWELAVATYPVLAVIFTHPHSRRRVGFRFVCDGWDDQAPSLTLFDPESKADLTWDKWPQGGWSVGNPHPTTGKPFLCLPGIHEYHTHSSHINDSWENYKAKGSYTLGFILHRVWQRFGVTNG